MKYTLAGIALAAVLLAPLGAQQEEATPAQTVQAAFQAWQAQHPGAWIMRVNPGTGTAAYLYGGRLEAPFTPSTDAEWSELARIDLQAAAPMTGVADSTLVFDAVRFLDLSRVGTSDKVGVRFHQAVGGVPVHQGSLTALFDAQGRMLAIQTNALPGAENLATRPVVGRFEAVSAAQRGYLKLEGRAATVIGQPELVVYKHAAGKSVEARLAWSIEMRTPVEAPEVPSGRRMFVAADVQGAEVLGGEQLVHFQGPNDIFGNAQIWVSPGTLPDHAGNPEALAPLRWATVSSSQGSTTTDANGDFVIPNASSTNVTFSLSGPFSTIVDQATANHTVTDPYTQGVAGSSILNPSKAALITAQANAFERANDMHVYVRGIDPGDGTMDFQIVSNTNISATCNAYYNGISVNFYQAGGGCVNTAYSTVVIHEVGHWANDLYGTGNGSSGIGEGMADVWSMFLYDDPITGEDFFGQGGGNIRTGNNTRQWCGVGCYGEVHNDGEVIMGALWKVRRNLDTTHGNAAGDALADLYNLSWFQVFNQTVLDPTIEDQWLTLDDNDGNVGNGTPNYLDIDGAFREQGFPGVDLDLIQILHTPLPNTQNEAGPYTVDANVTSLIGASITSVDLVYAVDGGAPVTVPMSNQGGGNYSADIPGQVSPAQVAYHIAASDDQGNNDQLPRGDDFGFFVGVFTQIYFNDFESASDEGWTHAGSGQDDWMHGVPQGKAGDPSSAASGSKCWGNDLGPSGWNGFYSNNVNNWVQSPAISTIGQTGVKLRFKRWLNVEQNVFDQANLKVNGTTVWSNPGGSDFIEGAWNDFELDISAWADNNPSVVFRFEMNTDVSVTFGGWNFDDFEVFTIGPVGGPVINTISLTGPSMSLTGLPVTYDWSGAPANSPYWFYMSKQLNGTTIHGQPFDIGPSLKTLATGFTSGTGTGTYTSIPIPGRFAGRTVYLEVRVDDVGTGATKDSNALQLDVL